MVIKASGSLLRELANVAVESHRDTRDAQDAVTVLSIDAKQREANETNAANDKDAVARQVALGMTVAKAMQTTVSETRKAGEAANDIGAKSELNANSEAATEAGGGEGAGATSGAGGAEGGDGALAGGEAALDALANTKLGGEDANAVGDVFSKDQLKTLTSGEKLTMEDLKGTEPPFSDKQCKSILEMQSKNVDGKLTADNVSDFIWDNRGRSETQAQGDQALKVSNAFITVMSAGSDGMLKLGGEQHRRGAKQAAGEAQIGAQSADSLGGAASQDIQLRNQLAMHVINGRRGGGTA
jgi:hypothetical protein